MKTVQIPISDLLRVLEKMSNDNMKTVMITVNEEVFDQHLEAYTKDGQAKDYESIDSM